MKKLIFLVSLLLPFNLYSQSFRVGSQNTDLQLGLGIDLLHNKYQGLSCELCFGLSTRDLLYFYPSLSYYPLDFLYIKTLCQPHFRVHGDGHQVYGDYAYSWLSLGLGLGVRIEVKENWGFYIEGLGFKNLPLLYTLTPDKKTEIYGLICLGLWIKIE